ncbi:MULTISPECIES: GntR family transcriptional regulator [Sphingobium]|uniref:HTH gntR-type domain-containing protein n=1 Tax=Sphingobium chungbukense TaxID=56193 RepID=A0A0M3ASA3_9SPHN|nr:MULTISPECIES: GntR family transcriptional regulator [Sphingobium]KKW91414.1 hypothetical protein YP76_17135 [Sphingobium chungbukense]PJG49682.1 hypothetical protein CAF53_04565 [Sphingobium sp. LB126]
MNASERAYAIIRQRILDGTFPPGSQLREEEIAEACGVSRTPVRDAMRRLETEMFVERSDSNRSFVTVWKESDLEELFMLRSVLESHAAERAAKAITADVVDLLKISNNRIAEAIAKETPDIETFLKENATFHELVVGAAASERLAFMISRLVFIPVVYKTAIRYDREELHKSLSDHREITAALEAGDAEWAGAAMKSHIRRAYHAQAKRS